MLIPISSNNKKISKISKQDCKNRTLLSVEIEHERLKRLIKKYSQILLKGKIKGIKVPLCYKLFLLWAIKYLMQKLGKIYITGIILFNAPHSVYLYF